MTKKSKQSGMKALFCKLAEEGAKATGSAYAFGTALLIVLIWLATGPIFDFSEIWQIVINTLTTIITFLLVFLIQNAQNRDMFAVHVKLDELIRATQGAENGLLDVEKLSDDEIQAIAKRYYDMGNQVSSRLESNGKPKAKASRKKKA